MILLDVSASASVIVEYFPTPFLPTVMAPDGIELELVDVADVVVLLVVELVFDVVVVVVAFDVVVVVVFDVVVVVVVVPVPTTHWLYQSFEY